MRPRIYFVIFILSCLFAGGARSALCQGGPPQGVVWTNAVNVTATGNSIQKTSGCDGCPDAGATSQQSIASGDGYFEFTVDSVPGQRFAGLSNGNGGTGWDEIDFAFRLWGASGDLDAQENGTYRPLGTKYAVGDVLRVAVEGGKVKYYKNGTLLYTSTAAPTYPLQVDTSLLAANSTVSNAVIAVAAPPDAAPARLIAQSVTTSKVTLYWNDASTNESGFKVERAPDAGGAPGAFTQVGTAAANATTYDDTTTAGNTTYYFRVRATNASGDSAYSNVFSITTPAAGRTLTTVRVFRDNTRVRVGEQVTFVCAAYDQNGVEFPAVVPQWSVSNGAVAQLLPDAELPMRDRWTYRYMYVQALSAGSSNVTATVAGVSGSAANMTAYSVSGPPAVGVGGDNAGGAITKKVGEVVFLDLSASQNLYEYVIDWGDGDKTTGVGEQAVHAYLAAGTYQVQVTVKNSAGTAATLASPINVSINPHTAHTTDGVDVFTATSTAELLSRYNSMPLTGGVIKIPKGTVMSGTVVLPERNFSDYVTIMSDGVMPDIRNRIANTSPELATVSAPTTNAIPVTVGKRAHHVRFIGIKVTVAAGVNTYYGFHVGDHDGTQDTTAEQAHDIIFQHCVVDSPDDSMMTHGMLVDGKRVSVLSSWIGNVKYNSGDATGITSYTGEGLHVYQNDFIEAAGECYITGGTTNAMKVTPSGVEFRRCYFTKRASWTTAQYNMKNHFETKMGRNIYVESSVMRYQKNNDQFYSIVLKSSNSGDSPGNAAEFVRVENCKVTEAQGGFNAAWDRYGTLSVKPRHLSLRNVLFDKVDSATYGARGRAAALGNADYVDIEHVTGLPDQEALAFDAGNVQYLTMKDNVVGAGGYGIYKGEDENGPGAGWGTTAFNLGTYGKWSYSYNVAPLYGSDARTPELYPNAAPNDHNGYPATAADVGFVDYLNGNYRLAATSPYKGAASDGTDPGINQDMIEQRTAHAQDGQWAQPLRGIVLNGSGQYGLVSALPSSAPYNSVGAFSIKTRLRAVATYGYVFALTTPDGMNRISALSIPGSGRIDLHDDRESPGLTVYHTPADLNDCVVEFSFDPANARWVVTSHRADGTGVITSTAAVTNTANWNFSGYRLSIGANYYGVINPAVKMDWFRWSAGGAQLADYEFDANDGRDTSGNGQHLSLYGSPAFEDSPPENN
jgi:hypothetical protein